MLPALLIGYNALYSPRGSLEKGPSTMNLEEGHQPTGAANMSSMAERFSLAAGLASRHKTRSELQCAKLGYKMFPIPSATFPLLFAIYTVRG